MEIATRVGHSDSKLLAKCFVRHDPQYPVVKYTHNAATNVKLKPRAWKTLYIPIYLAYSRPISCELPSSHHWSHTAISL